MRRLEFVVLSESLWGKETGQIEVNRDVFLELEKQTVLSVTASVFPRLSMPPELYSSWKRAILYQISSYEHNVFIQSNLPVTVPYVILKGTSAAQYYPHPEYRTMGDIDIMPRREDFDTVYQQLLDDGYKVTEVSEREISFLKNGIIVELHRFYASLNNPKQSQYLDDLIVDNIQSSHVLPDMVNGLVLLEHISQHMEHGLGLRQIIDWMMFVDRCLPDEKWPEFKTLAKNIGLKRLAVITTRMCEMYLGLPDRDWCKETDDSVCEELMEYILSCGNFGNKRTSEKEISQTVFTYIWRPVTAVKWLQERGLINWKAAQKHAVLRPFAWIYQIGRYISRGMDQEGSLAAVQKEYSAAKKRINLFNTLGVKQKSKGLVVYRDGQYRKK